MPFLSAKSKFGEIFDASLDHKGAYEVVLGDLSDYKKLGLVRGSSLVNFLTLEKPAVASGVKKVIHISSQNPLFFPSFNLVILAKHNGGILLENFLVTVDSQKGLALNALGRKNKKSIPPPLKTKTAKIESPIEKEKVFQPDQSSGLPEQEEAKVSRKPEMESSGPLSTSFDKVSGGSQDCSCEPLAELQNVFWGDLGCPRKGFSPLLPLSANCGRTVDEKH